MLFVNCKQNPVLDNKSYEIRIICLMRIFLFSKKSLFNTSVTILSKNLFNFAALKYKKG